MTCKGCEKALKGGFGIGERPFTEFRCFACLMRSIAENRKDEAEAEANYYLKALNEIWEMCIPNRKGNYRRGLGDIVLSKVADATSYRERKYQIVTSVPLACVAKAKGN